MINLYSIYWEENAKSITKVVYLIFSEIDGCKDLSITTWECSRSCDSIADHHINLIMHLWITLCKFLKFSRTLKLIITVFIIQESQIIVLKMTILHAACFISRGFYNTVLMKNKFGVENLKTTINCRETI